MDFMIRRRHGRSADQAELAPAEKLTSVEGGDSPIGTCTSTTTITTTSSQRALSRSKSLQQPYTTPHLPTLSGASNGDSGVAIGTAGSNSIALPYPNGSATPSIASPLHHLPPENDAEGNVEYKSTLVNPSPSRLQHLSTQMKWRLQEGSGQALYEIGVGDDGTLVGLSEHEMRLSLETLGRMADAIDASVSIVNKRLLSPTLGFPREPLHVVEAQVRRKPDTRKLVDLRLAILGAAESGKSTLCGVLTQGVLDNGQGKARLNIFRYLHEFRSGKTSSVCLDLVGFSQEGTLINYAEHSLEEVVEKSNRLLTLIDLAGDRKYLRTTIYGVTGYNPHYCVLMVNARQGPTAVSKEHLGLALALEIPLFVLISKADLVSDSRLKRVVQSVEELIRGLEKGLATTLIENAQDAISSASSMGSRRLVPLLVISNVSGLHLDLLYTFLNHLPQLEPSVFSRQQLHLSVTRLPLFYVEEVFRKSDAGYIVVCGILPHGVIHEGEEIQLGPTGQSGRYLAGKVESIHRNKQPVMKVTAGQTASLALSLASFSSNQPHLSLVKRGMVVISMDDEGMCCRRFIAQFCLLYHPSTEISIGFQGTVYIGSLCRTATVVNFDSATITPCKWTRVTFEFQRHEFVKVGMPLILRECMTKGMGEVVEVLPVNPVQDVRKEN